MIAAAENESIESLATLPPRMLPDRTKMKPSRGHNPAAASGSTFRGGLDVRTILEMETCGKKGVLFCVGQTTTGETVASFSR